MHILSILASGDDSGGSALPSLILLALIPLALYFFMIRPQRRRMRDQQNLQRSLGVGDEVITTSGIYGFITGEEGDQFWLEIDDDVQVRIARAAIQGKVDTSSADAPAPADDDGATKSENP
ncbi:MAG: preprotein translocase subunit YajC [Ilumatobacteraceae bacterium]